VRRRRHPVRWVGSTHCVRQRQRRDRRLAPGPGWESLTAADDAMVAADGTPTKARLGANATVGASMALARALADSSGQPLHAWLPGFGQLPRIPVPCFNVLNGGVHAPNALDFQEFMISPRGSPSIAEGVRRSRGVCRPAQTLVGRGARHRAGRRGRLRPQLAEPEEVLEVIVAVVTDAGYTPGRSGIVIALDPAAAEFRDQDGVSSGTCYATRAPSSTTSASITTTPVSTQTVRSATTSANSKPLATGSPCNPPPNLPSPFTIHFRVRVTVMVRVSAVRSVERELDYRRLAAQQLVGPPADGVVQVVDRLLAVQAQDLRAARLAVRARTTGLTAVDVDRELEKRTLVVTWLNRGTLHLVRSQDYWWLHRLTTPQLSNGNSRRLAQEGVPPDQADRGVAVIEAALDADGPMTRAQLREVVAAADVPVAGQALVHILALSAIRGLTVRGPIVGMEQGFVLVRDWLGDPPTVADRDTDLSELARRFLAGHGPVDERDLAKWAGITLGEARRGLRSAGVDLEEWPGGLVDLAGRDAPQGRPRPKLLGGFDPLLHGWVDRTPVLGGNETIVTKNGIFRPFALVDGRAVATWGMPRGRVTLEPFGPIAAPILADLDREARDVERFLTPAY